LLVNAGTNWNAGIVIFQGRFRSWDDRDCILRGILLIGPDNDGPEPIPGIWPGAAATAVNLICSEESCRTSRKNRAFHRRRQSYATAKSLGFDIDYKRLLLEFQSRGNLLRAFYYTAVIEDQEYSSIRR
jgi:hypothetical protein